MSRSSPPRSALHLPPWFRAASIILFAALSACAGSPEPAEEEPAPAAPKAPRAAKSPKAKPAPRAPAKAQAVEDSDPAPAAEPAPAAKTGAAVRKPAAGGRKAAGKADPRSTGAAQQAARIVRDLQDPARAEEAYREIWEAPREWIPALIEEVENPARSSLERIQVLILQRDFVGESKLFLANRIHGLGRMEEVEEIARDDLRIVSQAYTKISYGITRNKKGYRLVMDKFGGFPVGVVVRAGLLNRFRSVRFPSSSDDDPAPGKLRQWWHEYHRLADSDLSSVEGRER